DPGFAAREGSNRHWFEADGNRSELSWTLTAQAKNFEAMAGSIDQKELRSIGGHVQRMDVGAFPVDVDAGTTGVLPVGACRRSRTQVGASGDAVVCGVHSIVGAIARVIAVAHPVAVIVELPAAASVRVHSIAGWGVGAEVVAAVDAIVVLVPVVTGSVKR